MLTHLIDPSSRCIILYLAKPTVAGTRVNNGIVQIGRFDYVEFSVISRCPYGDRWACTGWCQGGVYRVVQGCVV